ncbi:hypothetical protein ES705_26853 [subsurface metagenome]
MRNVVLILLTLFIVSFADEYLVKVDLTEHRLTPLIDKDLKIVGELEKCAIILIDNSEFNKISSYSYQILDQKSQQGKYYFVRPLDSMIDLNKYGEILMIDNGDYLIRIKKGMLEELIKEKVMLKRLSFKPFIFRSETSPPRFLFDTTVQEIVDLVNADTVLSYVQRLQDFISRYSTYDSCFAAANYIASKFNDYGCDSIFFQNHTSGHAPNVIGVKRGVIHPDSIYAVICGHFDATSYLAPEIAPGADDNASGTASVLEATRVMKDYEFEYSIRYIAFSGEEFGLYGSEYYASMACSQGDNILGVLNGDMIAYVDAQPESLEVIAKISNPSCEPLADYFIAVADTYTTLLTNKRMVNSAPYSDHAPFWDNGYVALCNIEDMWPVNPYYHTPGDTIGAGYNNNDFCTEVIKAEVAALSIMAVPYTTSIDEVSNVKFAGSKLSIYPTVHGSQFTIVFNGHDPFIAIYNATGHCVKQFNHLTDQPFNHVVWYGKDNFDQKLPTGVYFVRIETNEATQVEKVVLIK